MQLIGNCKNITLFLQATFFLANPNDFAVLILQSYGRFAKKLAKSHQLILVVYLHPAVVLTAKSQNCKTN